MYIKKDDMILGSINVRENIPVSLLGDKSINYFWIYSFQSKTENKLFHKIFV